MNNITVLTLFAIPRHTAYDIYVTRSRLMFQSIRQLGCLTALSFAAFAQQTVMTPGGTQNAIPMYSGNATITNSVLFQNGGNIGIGTTTPGYILDLVNNQNSPTWLSVRNYNTGGNSQAAAIFFSSPTAAGSIGVVGSSNASFPTLANWFVVDANSNLSGLQFNTEGTQPILFSVNNSEAMRVSDAGNVGIGTANPQNKLSVNGTVQAKEVIVNAGWSDYVFNSDYKLQSLAEVAQFIQQNHHLPNIPSEADVSDNGIHVGDIESKLLAKIEELTLHVIQLSQQNDQLAKRMATLEKH